MIMQAQQDVCPARQEANCLWYASLLGRYTHHRRQELGLSIEQAAELAGIEASQWIALENGWLPDRNVVQSIAATLRVRWSDLDLMCLLARCAQRAINKG
jgi:transcriptional regulator with XRE-family HTH domain